MKLNDICPYLARIYRILNRPILRSKTDVDCKVYPTEETSEPVISLKINGAPEIKILDLILVIVAIKAALSLLRAIFKLFKN